MSKLYPHLNFNVVLVNPQIPNNTGNIGRLCVATWSRLHLIHPLGFEISDSRVKRAGLDYWNELELREHHNLAQWMESLENKERIFFFSSHADKSMYGHEFVQGDSLVFGKEADGLGPELLDRFSDRLLKIPFPGKVRSFNLANSVSMVLGEGMRQIG